MNHFLLEIVIEICVRDFHSLIIETFGIYLDVLLFVESEAH